MANANKRSQSETNTTAKDANGSQNETSIDETRYCSVSTSDLYANAEFPGDVFLCLRHKMVKYKNKDDILSSEDLNKLLLNQVQLLFVNYEDIDVFDMWISEHEEREKSEIKARVPAEAAKIAEAVQDQRRAMLDIFNSSHTEPQVKNAVDASKKIVTEFLKKPFAVKNIQALTNFSKGVIDHSVNVSTLAVFLGLRMGYSHQLILENLALGGLFHDLGKTRIRGPNDKMLSSDDPLMKQHPLVGRELLEKQQDKIPNEVLMIVSQHHEFMDGSGFPQGLKGVGVYDLTRIVTIANIFDHLVSESKKESMKERTDEAVQKLSTDYVGKLEARKLEKIVKILEYSL